MERITNRLAELIGGAVAKARESGEIPESAEPQIVFERPRRREHGDWSTNVALSLASGINPRSVAEAIVARIPESDLVKRTEVAGPGFINFQLAPLWFHDVVRRAATDDSGFGRSAGGAGKSVNVEFVSANPTGPVNVVSGRHAAIGDSLASLLEATGHAVTREFYVNDHGRQRTLFARSVAARYMELQGFDADIPEDGYQGEYVKDIAAAVLEEQGSSFALLDEPVRAVLIGDIAVARMIDEMKTSLERFGTRFDVWFSERQLHDKGDVGAVIERLRKAGYIEERDGALWFKSSEFGDDKDRVILRSNEEPTYLAGDAAYLMDKFERGFGHLIYLWGSDHHGTVVRLKAVAEALGYGGDRVEVPLVQVVTLVRGGAIVKSSKRAGDIVLLDELLDEVGVDAARYVFLSRSTDAPLEFDIELAAREAPENPVYYVQYAHARICSIMKKAGDAAGTIDPESADLNLLDHPSEVELMKRLDSYEETIIEACDTRGPHKICRYAEDLSAGFSSFYRDCRVVSDDVELTKSRLVLCRASRNVLAAALGLLGVSAPESM